MKEIEVERDNRIEATMNAAYAAIHQELSVEEELLARPHEIDKCVDCKKLGPYYLIA